MTTVVVSRGEHTMQTIDARTMQPPEPFERVIDALSSLPLGEEVCLLVPHEPRPLYRFLASNNYTWTSIQAAEGHWEVVIREKA